MTEALTEDIIETYEPLPKQIEFHKCSTRNKLYGGAMGGGKTRTLCEDINALMIEFPGNRGLILRKVYADFKSTTYLCLIEKVLVDFLEKGLIKENKADKVFHYWNGSKLFYGGLVSDGAESANERKKYFSGEYGVIAIDEAREVTEKEFEELSTRLRHKLPNRKFPPFFMLLGSNPSQNWLKVRFITNRKDGYAFFPALPKENTHNPPDYERQLRELFGNDEKLLQAYVEGSWDAIGEIDNLVTMAECEPLIERDPKKILPPHPFARRATVCDIARFGDDKTIIYDFVGPRVDKSEKYGKKDTMETVGRLLYHQQKNSSRLIGIDEIAVGSGATDRLREIVNEIIESERKYAIHAIDFRAQSSQPDMFLNLRAEIYWNLRSMIKDAQCALPDDQRLHGQICSIKYKFVGGGKLGTRIKIESKEDIKKRLGFSPDEADTYAMGLHILPFTPIDKKRSWRDKYKQDINAGSSHMSA